MSRKAPGAGAPAKRKPVVWDTLSPDYPGCIAQSGVDRLAVSPRGATYLVQEWRGAAWRPVRSFGSGPELRAWASVVAVDLPSTLVDAAFILPDDPRQCVKVPCEV